MPVITIRGQLGSGAPEVGREVARLIQGDYIDREVIAEIVITIIKILAAIEPPSREKLSQPDLNIRLKEVNIDYKTKRPSFSSRIIFPS